jgi:death-on-curing protein
MHGTVGVLRDEGLLESALMRPRMAAHYEMRDLAYQAATLVAGIALAHAFVDGNKRTAAIAARIFLDLNGVMIVLMPEDPADAFGQCIETLVLASHEIERAVDTLAEWLRARLAPRPPV